MEDTRIIKQTITCTGCENTFVLAYRSDVEDELTYCPFCGEQLEDSESEDE